MDKKKNTKSTFLKCSTAYKMVKFKTKISICAAWKISCYRLKSKIRVHASIFQEN
jgi:hypothetical protein